MDLGGLGLTVAGAITENPWAVAYGISLTYHGILCHAFTD